MHYHHTSWTSKKGDIDLSHNHILLIAWLQRPILEATKPPSDVTNKVKLIESERQGLDPTL